MRGAKIACAGAIAASVWLGACASGSRSTSTSTSTSTSAASYSTLLDAASHLLRIGNASAAEQLYQQAIAKAPANPAGHYDLGVAFQSTGDSAEALVEYNRALARRPSYVPALYNKAVMLSARNPALGIALYQRIIQIQPNSPTAYLNLGLLKIVNRSAREPAMADLRQALRLDPLLASRMSAPLRRQLAQAQNG